MTAPLDAQQLRALAERLRKRHVIRPSSPDVGTIPVCLEAADALDALLADRDRLRAALTWQPIETAPWSGPPVLLWKESTREHYVAARIRGAHGPGWCTPDGYEILRATHWMPLPEPLKETAP